MKRIYILLMSAAFLFSHAADAQPAEKIYKENIQSVKLYKPGDQTSFPVIMLNSSDMLELHFDDMENDIKNYYYSFQLCNADWSYTMLRPFDYIKGFQNVRITNYRNSSIANTRYTHYQATFPDRQSAPNRSGNYLLKVFLNGDTSQLFFTKRFVVVENKANVGAQVQQPFNATLFRTGQKLQITVKTDSRIQTFSPSDIKVVALQNNNWQTAVYMNRPTISRGNYFEYSDEAITAFQAIKEFRWIDLRSFRLKSDRVLDVATKNDSTIIVAKPETSRADQSYVYYRDINGEYTIEPMENVNPFWQSDYAYVHFSYFPPGNRPFEGKDLYMFGEITNYAGNDGAKMIFNKERGAYEKTMHLKQGYYNYLYATMPYGKKAYPDFSTTEGNYWGTENNYTILVYYKPFGARADELIGYTMINSILQRTGF